MKNKNLDLNEKELRRLATANITSVSIIKSLALRSRNREFMNLDSFKRDLISEGNNVKDQDYDMFWKGLESLGAGRIIILQGIPVQFKWFISLRYIAKVASDRSLDTFRDEVVEEKILIHVVLPSGSSVDVICPHGLSKEDVAYLAEVLTKGFEVKPKKREETLAMSN